MDLCIDLVVFLVSRTMARGFDSQEQMERCRSGLLHIRDGISQLYPEAVPAPAPPAPAPAPAPPAPFNWGAIS